MIEVYGLNSPNVVKIYIALEEVGLPYEVKPIDVFRGEQFTPEFLSLNPNAKVPVLVDPDGPDGAPITLFESGAILLYLAEKTGQLLPTDPRARLRAIQWLFHQHAGLGPMGGQLAHFKRFAPKGLDPYSEQRYRSENNRLYDLYDRQLGERAYLGGDSYSIADIAVWPWIVYHELHLLDLRRRKNLSEWYDRLGAREAVQRAAAVHGKPHSQATIDATPSDDLDRFFIRGKYQHT